MLAGKDVIEHALGTGQWEAYRDNERVWPSELTIGPHSIDVTLSPNFMEQQLTDEFARTRVENPFNLAHLAYHEDQTYVLIDPYLPNEQQVVTYKSVTGNYYDLCPGNFILGCARERFVCSKPVRASWTTGNELENPYFTQMYDGRSTMGRLGILSHVTAGYGDYGFEGNFTLEIANVGRAAIRLHAGMRIGQISFHATSCLSYAGPEPYGGAYPLQRGAPVAPLLGRERFVNKSEQ